MISNTGWVTSGILVMIAILFTIHGTESVNRLIQSLYNQTFDRGVCNDGLNIELCVSLTYDNVVSVCGNNYTDLNIKTTVFTSLSVPGQCNGVICHAELDSEKKIYYLVMDCITHNNKESYCQCDTYYRDNNS